MYTTFHYIHYISQRSNAKNCFRITRLQRQDSKPSADNNKRYSPSKSITECIKFAKTGELWTDFWQLDDTFWTSLVGMNSWKTDSRFFFLPRHMAYGRVGLARVRPLRYALPISLLILRKKTDCFALYPLRSILLFWIHHKTVLKNKIKISSNIKET